MSFRIAIVAAAFAASATAAFAQIQTLPQQGRAETNAAGINSALGAQERSRATTQQNQFEINALRNQAPQPSLPPPPVLAPGAPRR